MQWETVIGLEIHAQLATDSKIFSAASTAFGAEPNTQASAVDLGLPGVLPVVNKDVVRMAVKFALATKAAIGKYSVFARKNYFYPDLPKGYQISQMDYPIVGKGSITVSLPDGTEKTVGLTRAHLEEDAGKSVHDLFEGSTGIDLNRAGTPLLEIVSEPDMRTATEAVAYARYIHSLVRYIDICDGNMQEGSFRCDANVSIRPTGDKQLGTRTEIKNLNSFRFLERAIEYEVERQMDILEDGGRIIQETRLYDADEDMTRSMRSKEEANDYRYFPCPDLPPLVIDDAFIDAVAQTMPELPAVRQARFTNELGIAPADAQALCSDKQTANYFEAVLEGQSFAPKLAANWVLSELFGRMNKEDISLSQQPVAPASLGMLIQRVDDGTLSGKLGKQVFDALWSGEQDVDSVIEARGLKQISDTGAIEAMIDESISVNPSQLAEYRAGKEKLLSFFVGAVICLLYTSPSPRDRQKSRMPSSA